MAADAMKAGVRIGPYELISPIGAGGMGEVWKARDTRLDRVVAMKFSQAQFSDRFEREARAVAALNHPNIAQIYDVGENYIVMEFVEGAPVSKPDSIRKLLDIAAQIADGLAAAHAAGFVHRDLKPDNILVTREGRVKILDFGLAKATAAATASTTEETRTVALVTNPGTVMGTVAYMSPEQARGQDLDARTDQFSFGLILYELAAGKRAFNRPSAAETMTAIIRDEPEPLPAHVPALFRWTVERLLDKEPDRRYASTRDLLAELRVMPARLSEVDSTKAGSGPVARHGTAPLRIGMGVLLVISAALGWAVLSWREPPSRQQFRFTPVAVEGVDEDEPAWSPDGRSIAYKTRFGRLVSLTVKNVDGGSAAIKLVTLPYLTSFSWSSDGERIYYQGYVDEKSVAIWSVARAGGDPVRLTLNGAGDTFRSPAMSPDGKTLAMLGPVEGKKQTVRIWLSSPAGAKPVPIGPEMSTTGGGAQLAWSPDSTKLLARIPSEVDDRRLWLVPLKGEAKQFLRVPNIMSPAFSWLSDNRHVVIAQLRPPYTGQDVGLFLLDTRSETLSPLLPSADAILSPAVSPDGKRIAYVSGGAGFGLVRIPLGGGPPAPLMPVHVEQHSPAWSPRQNEFAFVRNHRLTVSSRDGSMERVLASPGDFRPASEGAFLLSPEFSPDGQKIAYSCSGCDSEGFSIWSSPVSGGSPARLTRRGEGGTTPSWSPDGKWIVYSRMGPKGGLYKIRIGSGEEPIRIREAWCPLAAWSPSGNEILCAGTAAASLLDPDGKQTRDLGSGVSAATWSRDGKSIYAIRVEPGAPHLYRVDLASIKWQALTELPPNFFTVGFYGGVARLSPAPDNAAVDVAVLERDGDIWILDGFERPRTLWERLWPAKQGAK